MGNCIHLTHPGNLCTRRNSLACSHVRDGKESYDYFYRVFACRAIVSQP